MGTIPLSDYLASRPTATTPLDDADRLMVMQGGTLKQVASDNVGAALITPTLINSTITPITLLPADGEAIYIKSNEGGAVAGFDVSVAGQTMCQELQNGLAGLNESIRVKLIGVHWYRVG
jgi:hypothetical protein